LRDFTTKFEISLEQTCFFGDDVNDLSAMEIVGLCACHRTQPLKCSPTLQSTAIFRRYPMVLARFDPSPTPSLQRAISAARTSFNFVRRSNLRCRGRCERRRCQRCEEDEDRSEECPHTAIDTGNSRKRSNRR
jgi:hypothetical protein